METKLKVKLLRHTQEPEKVVAQAARLCYFKSDIDDLLEKMTDEKCKELILKLVSLGHESPFEHASFTFGVEGVSRACTHQLVRHRIASYSQQSQRYVDEKEFPYIIPPSIARDAAKKKRFEAVMAELNTAYQEMREIAPKEDARFVLPNACETKIIITMNARELKHFFEKRCCERAQWEIRNLANAMLSECKKVAPNIFSSFGPTCVSMKICFEGSMSCGKWKGIDGAIVR